MSQAVPSEDLEKALAPYFPAKVGAKAKPIRLVSGLFMLQHSFDVSDEDALQNWIENPYWQFFCPYDYLQWELPIDPSSMSRWRKRIGVKGAEAILRATVRAVEITGIVKPASFKRVIADTTVMEKNVTYPRDVQLYLKSLQAMVRIANQKGIRLRQTYTRIGKRHPHGYGRYSHATQMKRAQRELKKLRTITQRVLRELKKWIIEKEEEKPFSRLLI